jgi:hypothetical protein
MMGTNQSKHHKNHPNHKNPGSDKTHKPKTAHPVFPTPHPIFSTIHQQWQLAVPLFSCFGLK